MCKPDINKAAVEFAAEHSWFIDAHYMQRTGTYKVVVKDSNSIMYIRYFEVTAELKGWAEHVQLAD